MHDMRLGRSEEHTSELQSRQYLVCRLLLDKKNITEGLTKPSALLFLLRSLIMFQTFVSRNHSNFFSDKLDLTSVTPASSAPVLQTPKATSSTLYFDSMTDNAGNGGFIHCIQMDTSVNAAIFFFIVRAPTDFSPFPKPPAFRA